mmetsp:Transcript_35079/g.139273  ORF Transcript_35079/g.139273 Transcript_35079/m.139273 type:complete len:393 (-) Transcript_35079:66-1244(-)
MLATETRSCLSPPFLLYGKFLLGLHCSVVEQVSESFYVTVQKWADERKHLKLGCFLRYMDEAPGQEQVLFLLRLFRNLEGLSIDRWKWARSVPDICSFVIENYTSERLRSFDVEDQPISKADIKNLATRCPNITHLGLRYCDIVDDLFLGNELPKLWPHSLSSIDISNCPNVTATGLRKLFGFVSSIKANSIRQTGRTLRLVRGGRTPIREGEIHMSGWRSVESMHVECPRTVRFCLSRHQSLQAVTVIGLAATWIDLYDCRLLNRVEFRCPNLTILTLARCSRLVSADDIYGLEDCRKLRFLNLHGTGLSQLHLNLASLETLILGGCQRLTHCRLELPKLKTLQLPKGLLHARFDCTIVCPENTEIQGPRGFRDWPRYSTDGMLHISSPSE